MVGGRGMMPLEESVLVVHGVAGGNSGRSVDVELPGMPPKQVRQSGSEERGVGPASRLATDSEMPVEAATLAPHGTKVAIEKDDESGKLIVRVKDAVTG